MDKIRITEEFFERNQHLKKYHNKENIRVGDIMIYVFLLVEKKEGNEKLLTNIREDHLTKLYEPFHKNVKLGASRIPLLRIKKDK